MTNNIRNNAKKIFKIGNIELDPISIALASIALLFVLSFASKFFIGKGELQKERKQLEIANISKVCINDNAVTDCYDISAGIYKIYEYKENEMGLGYTILITRK